MTRRMWQQLCSPGFAIPVSDSAEHAADGEEEVDKRLSMIM